MREVMIESPNVHWSDIGGLETVKQELKESGGVAFDLRQALPAHGSHTTQGSAALRSSRNGQDHAGESGGHGEPGQLHKHQRPGIPVQVGRRPEKAVRETFRRARQASPSVVFPGRDRLHSPDQGRRHVRLTRHREGHIQFTELDGLEPLNNVIVIAATNRPGHHRSGPAQAWQVRQAHRDRPSRRAVKASDPQGPRQQQAPGRGHKPG